MRRRKWLLVLVLALSLALSSAVDAGMATMSDASAKSKAVSLWGPHAGTAKFWHVGAAGNWIYQLGCWDQAKGFLVVSQSDTSWEKAFTLVDPAHNGQFRILTTARQTDGQTTFAPVITVYTCNATFQ